VLSYSISNSFIYKAPSFKDFTPFVTCEDLGVLSGTAGNLSRNIQLIQPPSQVLTTPSQVLTTLFKMSGVLLIASIPTNTSVQIPCFNLTRFGVELVSLSEGFERDTKYEQEFIDFIKRTGATVRRALVQTGQSSSSPLEDV
jgi:hypothetical protein